MEVIQITSGLRRIFRSRIKSGMTAPALILSINLQNAQAISSLVYNGDGVIPDLIRDLKTFIINRLAFKSFKRFASRAHNDGYRSQRNHLALFINLSLTFLTFTDLYAIPKKVIMIRHGEKIQKGNQLNIKGYERAAALPYYFSAEPQYNNPPIVQIFAPALEEADSSVRPIQTCSPTSNHYGIPLNISFNHTEVDALAKEILKNPKYNDSTVLVCWSHGHIRPLVLALGGDDPGTWASNIFDQVYLLTYTQAPKPKLDKILQQLLFGDRTSFTDPLPPMLPSKMDEE